MASADQSLPLDKSTAQGPHRRLPWRAIGFVAVGAALLSALATFLVLSGLTPLPPTHNVVVSLLGINGLAALFLVAVIAREITQIVQARRHGRAGSRLHVRIVGLFAIIAAVPTILVAIVATITLDRGLDRFFSARTKAIVENSISVAEAYLGEHAQMIRGDIVAMAQDVARAKPLFDSDRERFQQFFTAQATIRGLQVAVILNDELDVVARTSLRATQDFAIPNKDILKSLNETQPQIAIIPGANYVAGIIKLRNFENMYLYVVRSLDPRVVAHLRDTRASVSDYALMEARRTGVTVAFGLMYTVIALIVLLSAVLIGLNFANRLVSPIRRLIGAANVVATGNLHVQVPVNRSEGDLGQLGETFNRMTHDLRTQRDDLVSARDLIDSRRRFSEAVLAGASAGILGVDHDGKISILNRSAEHLIGSPSSDVMGKPLLDVVPELAELVGQAIESGQRLAQGQVTLNRKGRERNLSVRVATEQSADAEHGYVVTLDDITDLVAAQRTSAWADVARRIAHEIKNPLTPIQLSAERLRRKYGKVIVEDRAIFDQCTDTIVRQVDDIGRMVDEFSALRAHAEAGHRAGRRRRHRAPGGVPDAGRPCRHRYRIVDFRGSDAGAFRRPAGVAGSHQHHQEWHRGHFRAARRLGKGPHRRHGHPRRRRGLHRRDRQWHRPPEREPLTPARTLCDHPREGDRTRSCDRREDSGRAWWRNRIARCIGERSGAPRRVDKTALCRQSAATEQHEFRHRR